MPDNNDAKDTQTTEARDRVSCAGEEAAVETLVSLLAVRRTPSILFLGSTGISKTEMFRKLAEDVRASGGQVTELDVSRLANKKRPDGMKPRN